MQNANFKVQNAKFENHKAKNILTFSFCNLHFDFMQFSPAKAG